MYRFVIRYDSFTYMRLKLLIERNNIVNYKIDRKKVKIGKAFTLIYTLMLFFDKLGHERAKKDHYFIKIM